MATTTFDISSIFGSEISSSAGVSSQLVPAEPIPALLAHKLLCIPDVETVYIKVNGRAFHVWTIVDAPDDSILAKIFSAENVLIKEFPTSGFDFNVIERRGRHLRSIITLGCPGWTKAFQK